MAKPVKHGNSWRIRWIDSTGARRSECFKTYRDAEYALRKHQTEEDEIRLGLKMPRLPDKTFADLCEHYLKYRSSQKRNPQDDASIIRVHLLPFFGTVSLVKVGGLVKDLTLAKASLNPKTLHNILTLLVSMLNFAVEERWLTSCPRIKKPKIRLLDTDFKYLRTKSEIDRFLQSAKFESDLVFGLYATALYTGMRAGELAGLKWSDVDFAKRLICVQRSYDGPTKNGEIRYIPILDVLLPILIKLHNHRLSSEYVFPNEEGNFHQRSSRVFQEVLHRVLDRAGFKKQTASRRVKHYIVFHDLRHTFASHWMMNNGNIFRLQKILGHKTPQMTQRYAHLEPQAFREDYARLGEGEIVTPISIAK